jgi:hypothetical protein
MSRLVYREKAEAHAGRRDLNASSVGAVNMEHKGFGVEVASAVINKEFPDGPQ